MNRMCFSLLLGGFLCAGVPAGAQEHIAREYVKGQGIEVDDLWGVVADHPEYYAGGDGTHPVDAGFDALARQVAKVVGAALEGLE